jgi:RNA polymerase sigma-70 factor (ECF subfamily)
MTAEIVPVEGVARDQISGARQVPGAGVRIDAEKSLDAEAPLSVYEDEWLPGAGKALLILRIAPMDERDLIRKSQAGDLRAFELLVRGRREQVFRIARQILGDDEEAKDVSQLVFIRLWQSLGRYREEGSFGSYLHRITLNLALDFARRQASERADAMEALEEAESPGGAGGRMEPGEIQRIFRVLSRRLSPRQRAAFVLREIEGMETEEVAKILGMTVSTVRNHVAAARKTLQEGLRRLFPEYARGKTGGGDG